MSIPPWGNHPPAWLNQVGYALLGLLLLIMLRATETSDALYRGGFLLVSLITVSLVYLCGNEQLSVTRLLNSSWLRWFGLRSYSLYVWHWPIFTLLRPGFELPSSLLFSGMVRFALTFLVAELSYRYVEQPFRHMTLGWVQLSRFTLGTALFLPVMAYAPHVSGFINRNDTAPRSMTEEVRDNVANTPIAPPIPGVGGADDLGLFVVAKPKVTEPKAENPQVCQIDPAAFAATTTPRLTFIGDSVLLGAKDYMTRHIASLWVDAKVGRQGSEGMAAIQELEKTGKLSDSVVLHLGTNGYLAEKHLRAMLHELEGRKVILVNIHAPRRWTEDNNDLLETVVMDFPAVKVMNWSGMSADHDEYFVADGIHLTGKGIRRYTEALGGMLGVTLYTDDCARKISATNTKVQQKAADQPIAVAAGSSKFKPADMAAQQGTQPAASHPVDTHPVTEKPAPAASTQMDGNT